MAVEISEKDNTGFVIESRSFKDVSRQRKRVAQVAQALSLVSLIERLQCQRRYRRDGIEDAQQRIAVALLVAHNQLVIVKVVARIHSYTRRQPAAHFNFEFRIQQRDFDSFNFAAIFGNQFEAVIHCFMHIAASPITGQRRIKHLTEPMQNHRFANLGQDLAIDGGIIVNAARTARQRPARHQDYASSCHFDGLTLFQVSAQHLISRMAFLFGKLIGCGAATDQLSEKKCHSRDEVLCAYLEQCEAIEVAGGCVILMASRALARCARSVDDYAAVYGKILSQVRKPVILHWLGEMFDPALAGYWGSSNVHEAMDHCLKLISEYRSKVEGIKISLLDTELEIEMRRRLPTGVRMYTGDDFHYDELIVGDEQGHSDALLGIFDAIAPVAALALQSLDKGDKRQCLSSLRDTLPLSRHIFEAPTFNYKTGIVFLAYLNGHQSHFRMVGGSEGARSVTHLSELFILADSAGLLSDPGLACNRVRLMLSTAGIT